MKKYLIINLFVICAACFINGALGYSVFAADTHDDQEIKEKLFSELLKEVDREAWRRIIPKTCHESIIADWNEVIRGIFNDVVIPDDGQIQHKIISDFAVFLKPQLNFVALAEDQKKIWINYYNPILKFAAKNNFEIFTAEEKERIREQLFLIRDLGREELLKALAEADYIAVCGNTLSRYLVLRIDDSSYNAYYARYASSEELLAYVYPEHDKRAALAKELALEAILSNFAHQTETCYKMVDNVFDMSEELYKHKAEILSITVDSIREPLRKHITKRILHNRTFYYVHSGNTLPSPFFTLRKEGYPPIDFENLEVIKIPLKKQPDKE